MCRECSIVVSKDAKTAYLGKYQNTHSHSEICADHKLDVDNVFKFEIYPRYGRSWKDSPTVKNFYIVEDTIPFGSTNSKIAMAQRSAWKAFLSYYKEKSKYPKHQSGLHIRGSTVCNNPLYFFLQKKKGRIEFWADRRYNNLSTKFNDEFKNSITRLSLKQLTTKLTKLQKKYPKDVATMRKALVLLNTSKPPRKTVFKYDE